MTTPTPTPAAPTEAQKRSKAYAEAEKALRAAHPAEFQDLHEKASLALGLAFKRKLTKQEKAKAEIIRLAAEHAIDLDSITDSLVLEADAARASQLRPAAV